MDDKGTSVSSISVGMLHFDVSSGGTAEVLVGALAQLCDDLSIVRDGLKACGILELEPILRQESRRNISGACVDFILPSGFSIKNLRRFAASASPTAKRLRPHETKWHRRAALDLTQQADSKIEAEETPEPAVSDSQGVSSWIRGEPFTLAELEEILTISALAPIAKALAIKTVSLLKKTLSETVGHDAAEHFLPGHDGIRILCELVAFVQLYHKLDPISVTATSVAISNPIEPTHDRRLELVQNSWALVLSQGIPTLERSWPAPFADCLGLALLKTVSRHFGPRHESVLLKHGIGIGSNIGEPTNTGKALWCAPKVVSSRAGQLDAQGPLPMPLVELTATLGPAIDVTDLLNRLHTMGMTSILTWQVLENGTHPKTVLRGLMRYPEAGRGVEALLITADSTQVTTSVLESQSLQYRSVSVPFGQGQKMAACKVNEWLWGGKVLRVDPDSQDLATLTRTTGFPQEVVRADVLAAWRKWRAAEAE